MNSPRRDHRWQQEAARGRRNQTAKSCCGGRRVKEAPARVSRRVKELQRLVPGGRDLTAAQLLLRTADYIRRLRLQVQVLRILSDNLGTAPAA
ncbi:hypothetical protein ZIOFF_017622 [Zingiber officinale]|uniref:BHLH domain-containing protein n=1 Tax=Zingiber officinale TaxID=94328 RepID=A0A8J5H4X4_ZINOF|nr:hypothetical protein ZIOFF_017622 [Zingiber officinale]